MTVKLEEFNGKKNPKVRYMNTSELPTCHHVWKEKAPAANTPNLDPEDLPF
ncbi:hypothetical protein AAFF39_03830 [Lactococcus garvieae]